jgi:hypothetical protein
VDPSASLEQQYMWHMLVRVYNLWIHQMRLRSYLILTCLLGLAACLEQTIYTCSRVTMRR